MAARAVMRWSRHWNTAPSSVWVWWVAGGASHPGPCCPCIVCNVPQVAGSLLEMSTRKSGRRHGLGRDGLPSNVSRYVVGAADSDGSRGVYVMLLIRATAASSRTRVGRRIGTPPRELPLPGVLLVTGGALWIDAYPE